VLTLLGCSRKLSSPCGPAHKTVVSDQQALNKARQDVRDAQKADEHAQAVRNKAIQDANTAYDAWVAAHPTATPAQKAAVAAAPADNPATPLVNEHQVALDKAFGFGSTGRCNCRG
jgi:hypothetical protein